MPLREEPPLNMRDRVHPAERVPVRKQLVRARMQRDFATAERLSDELLRKQPESADIRRSLARMLDHLGRSAEARHHWRRLHEQDGHDFEAAFHVANSLMDDGATADAALDGATARRPAQFRDNLRAALETNRNRGAADTSAHHVVICGVSFSGSTLMDRILGGLPGVRSIGESHWLTKARFETGYDLIDFDNLTAHPMPNCSVCNAKCEVLTVDFRRSLAADYTDWYFRISERLQAGTLISADKNPPKLIDHDPLLRFDALVMFKSPIQAWISHREKLAAGQDDASHLRHCRTYMDTWTQAYDTLLNHFRPAGKMVYLSFDRFVEEPATHLEALCGALNLPYDPAVLEATRPGHAIGGNARAMARIRASDYRIEISALPNPDLPPAELELIAADERVAAIHAGLLAAHADSR